MYIYKKVVVLVVEGDVGEKGGPAVLLLTLENFPTRC